MKKWMPLALIILFALCIAVWHNFIPAMHLYLHDLYPLLYQFPVVLAGFYYGKKGGTGVAALVTVLSIPHILFILKAEPLQLYQTLFEVAIYFVVGLAIGHAADRLRREQREKAGLLERFRMSEKLSALGELTYVITHELKTPIASISGAVELIKDGIGPGQKGGDYLAIMEKELKRMNDLVNSTLSVFREKRLEKRKVSIAAFFREVSAIASVMGGKGPAVTVQIDAKSETVLMSPDLMKEAFLNIIANALEASAARETGSGPARVEIIVTEGSGMLSAAVRDYGPGMDEETQKRIFTPFFTTKKGGTGLGLAVARRIVELHEGSLTCGAPPGGGSLFTISIPLAGGEL